MAALLRKPQTYREATYESPWRLIRYAHLNRLDTAIELITASRPKVVVDYGAGDGELVAQLLRDPRAASVELAISYEPLTIKLELAEERFTKEPRAAAAGSFDQIDDRLDGRATDVVSCLGALEHFPLVERQRFYLFCARRLSPHGRVVIDVPVEIGPSLVIKTLGRRVLKRRGREYARGELIRAVFGAETIDPDRFDPDSNVEFLFTHKGFDHRPFLRELDDFQDVIDVTPTPVRWLPGWLCNQEMLLLSRPRPDVSPDSPRFAGVAGSDDSAG